MTGSKMPTLESRLAKRLRDWQQTARRLRHVQEELHPDDEEQSLISIELGRLERCIEELAADLMARSAPSPAPVLARSVEGDGDDLPF